MERLEYWRATDLRSSDSMLQFQCGILPPREVANFLIEVYFDYAQTNTLFVDQDIVESRTRQLYDQTKELTADDAPWVCSVLMVLSIGAQFSHMADGPQNDVRDSTRDNKDEATEDAISITLYQMAAKLIPDIMTIASVESVQAFLLLAHFALPIDACGLAYTYLGLAVNMAVQNGMHRKYQGSALSDEMLALRNRLWWTAYGWEKRVSISHGRPSSIAASDMDVAPPLEISAVSRSGKGCPRSTEITMFRLTEWLETISSVVQSIRRCARGMAHASLGRLTDIRQQYKHWWSGQAISQIPVLQLNRISAHLHLCHNLNLVFMGRSFIFTSRHHTLESNKNRDSSTLINELIEDAEYSAYNIIDICAMLDKSKGLARASYVEYSSCRAAVLVMLAQSISGRCHLFREKLDTGVGLIQKMAVNIASTNSTASLIAAIDKAIKQMKVDQDARDDNARSETPDHGYANFKKWASLWQDQRGSIGAGQREMQLSNESVLSSETQSTFGEIDWSSLFDWDMTNVTDVFSSTDNEWPLN